MTQKIKKQFGVWMDTHHATVVGRANPDAEVFISVIDSSQRPPIFEKPRYTFAVKEGVKQNSVVGVVSARSSDSG